MQTKSKSTKEAQDGRRWFIVDAKGQVLGRLASRIAHILRGKHNAYYAPHLDTGDFVIVINAGEVKLTGSKMANKEYTRHTGWVGGIRTLTAEKLIAKKPEAPIEIAVKGMLPKNILGRDMFKKLKVYATADHPHKAQKAQPLTLA